MPEVETIEYYSCKFCDEDFWDDYDECVQHEEDCYRNPAVIELERAKQDERQRQIRLGLTVEETQEYVPVTLRASEKMLEGNARLDEMKATPPESKEQKTEAS